MSATKEKQTLTVRRMTDEEAAEVQERGHGGMPWLIVEATDSDSVLFPRSMLGAVPAGEFRYRCAVDTVRDYYARRGYGVELESVNWLCFNCGEIAPESSWTYLQHDEETWELRPSCEGESDPVMVCPHCNWHHVDDDANPGVLDGSFDELVKERAKAEIGEGREVGYKDFWDVELGYVDILALLRLGDEQAAQRLIERNLW